MSALRDIDDIITDWCESIHSVVETGGAHMLLTGEWVVSGVGFGLVMLGALTAVTFLGMVVLRGERRNRGEDEERSSRRRPRVE
jgi:hypothetical protein